jgi:hypothetical protein
MRFITVRTIYHDSNGAQHTEHPHRTMDICDIVAWATNWDDIRDEKSVTSVVYDLDAKRIIQASGYSDERGMFCDLY